MNSLKSFSDLVAQYKPLDIKILALQDKVNYILPTPSHRETPSADKVKELYEEAKELSHSIDALDTQRYLVSGLMGRLEPFLDSDYIARSRAASDSDSEAGAPKRRGFFGLIDRIATFFSRLFSSSPKALPALEHRGSDADQKPSFLSCFFPFFQSKA